MESSDMIFTANSIAVEALMAQEWAQTMMLRMMYTATYLWKTCWISVTK